MSECAYPFSVCNSNKEIDFEDKKIHFCEDCLQLLLLCDKCRETNRSLARYCRKCGREISFTEEEKKLESSYKITASGLNEKNQVLEITLDKFNLGERIIFYSYLNYGIILSDNGKGVIFNIFSPDNPIIHKYDFSDKERIYVSPEFHTESIFFFTTKAIYKWNLFRNNIHPQNLEKIFPDGNILEKFSEYSIFKKPLISDEFIFLFLSRIKDQKIDDLKFLILDRDGNFKYESSSIEEEISFPILVGHEKSKVLFFSKKKLYFIHLAHEKFLLETQDCPQHSFNPNIRPSYYYPIVFIPGNNYIYSFNHTVEEPVPERFVETNFTYKFINDKLNLFIVKNEGACFASGPTGFDWDSTHTHPPKSGPSFKYYPTHYNNVFGFVSMEGSESSLNMVKMDEQPKYLFNPSPGFKKILSQPVIKMGFLFLIHLDQNNEKKLSVFRL